MTTIRSLISTVAMALGLNSIAAWATSGMTEGKGTTVKARPGNGKGRKEANRGEQPSCIGGF